MKFFECLNVIVHYFVYFSENIFDFHSIFYLLIFFFCLIHTFCLWYLIFLFFPICSLFLSFFSFHFFLLLCLNSYLFLSFCKLLFCLNSFKHNIITFRTDWSSIMILWTPESRQFIFHFPIVFMPLLLGNFMFFSSLTASFPYINFFFVLHSLSVSFSSSPFFFPWFLICFSCYSFPL